MPTASDRTLQVIALDRTEDVSGVSGTGRVAYGVEFPDGTIVLRWDTEVRSTVFYESRDNLETIVGHGGRTRIVELQTIDPDPEEPTSPGEPVNVVDAFCRVCDRVIGTWTTIHGTWPPLPPLWVHGHTDVEWQFKTLLPSGEVIRFEGTADVQLAHPRVVTEASLAAQRDTTITDIATAFDVPREHIAPEEPPEGPARPDDTLSPDSRTREDDPQPGDEPVERPQDWREALHQAWKTGTVAPDWALRQARSEIERELKRRKLVVLDDEPPDLLTDHIQRKAAIDQASASTVFRRLRSIAQAERSTTQFRAAVAAEGLWEAAGAPDGYNVQVETRSTQQGPDSFTYEAAVSIEPKERP